MDQPFQIGEWRVEPALNRLVRQQQTHALEPRLMRLLVLLAATPKELVPKDVIFSQVWGGLSVTDESLAQAISKLRKLLDDDPEGPIYIETIRKKGYRLLADVSPASTNPHKRLRTKWVAAMAVAVGLGLAVLYGALWSEQKSEPTARYAIAQPITGTPGRERDPSLSPNSDFLVYSATDDTGTEQIFLHGIGRGTADRQLTAIASNFAPVVLPDNQSVVFMRKRDPACSIMLLSLIDGAERVLGPCTGNSYPDVAVSFDGSQIAFSAKHAGAAAHQIMVLDLPSGTSRAVTSPPPAIWGDYDPVFSADGREIYFARSESEAMQDVYRLEVANGSETRLTQDGQNIMGISMTENQLYFASNRDGRYGIWSISTEGTGLQRLAVSASGIINPSVSADGDTMVFESLTRVSSLQRTGTEGKPLFEFNNEILHPDVTDNFRDLIFSSNRSGFFEIWRADTSGGHLTRLTDFRSGFTAHPRFSPDGAKIAFDARPNGTAQIFVMDDNGANQRAVAPTDNINRYAPTWTPDGSGLIYAKPTNGQLELWQLNLTTGAETQITTTGATFGYLLEDGSLFHTRPAVPGVWKTSAEQDVPELVLNAIHFSDWGNWATDGSSIRYFDRTSNSLKTFELKKGRAETTRTIDGYVPTADPAIAISSDGKDALVVIRLRLESDIGLATLGPPPVR